MKDWTFLSSYMQAGGGNTLAYRRCAIPMTGRAAFFSLSMTHRVTTATLTEENTDHMN